MNHPDKSFTMYQTKLDDYEEWAVLDILKAKPFIDEKTQQRINQIEQKRMIITVKDKLVERKK